MTTDQTAPPETDAEDVSDVPVAELLAEEEIRSHTSPGRARLELLVVGFAALTMSLSQSVLVPVLGILPGKLDTSASNVEWLLTSTLLVGAISVPVFGRLGDMYGKRRMLLVAISALLVGSLITSFSNDIGVLIVGRAVQGASLAAIPLGISLLSSLLPRERVGSAISLISAMLGVGGALGLPLAGFVAEYADFHVLFWITAGASAISLVATLLVVPESPVRTGGRVDLVGVGLLSAALVCLLLPLAQTSTWGWGSTRVVGLLAAAVVLFAVFGLSQTRIRQPMVDLATLRRRPIVLTNLASVLVGFALFASMIGTANYVLAPHETGYGFDTSLVVSGLCLVPGGLGMLIMSPFAARLIAFRGAPQTLALGAAIIGLGWVSRLVLTGSLWEVVFATTISSIGTGVGYAAMPALINAHTPMSEIASANGINSLARSLGTSLASALGGSLLAASTVVVGGLAYPTQGAFQLLFLLCVIASGLAAVVALAIPAAPLEPER